jgi:small conductance mechanosensitive channel
MTIKARLTTRAMRQWRIGREFNRRMKKRFEELNISPA